MASRARHVLLKMDLHHFVGILDGWFDNPQMLGIFKAKPELPTNARPVNPVGKLALKETKWGSHRVPQLGSAGLSFAG